MRLHLDSEWISSCSRNSLQVKWVAVKFAWAFGEKIARRHFCTRGQICTGWIIFVFFTIPVTPNPRSGFFFLLNYFYFNNIYYIPVLICPLAQKCLRAIFFPKSKFDSYLCYFERVYYYQRFLEYNEIHSESKCNLLIFFD